jgi:glycosyltransferase involved in cell wall biosynthesis
VSTIDFLHLGSPFSGGTLRSASMGGTESSVVQLAEALARRGHDVAVFNAIAAPRQEFGVSWWPISEAAKRSRGDIGIAVSTPKAFNGTSFRQHIFWLHNPLKSWRQIRRGNVWPLLKARPTFVLLGDYHAAHVPRWLPSAGRAIILHGVHGDFFRREPDAAAPPPRAIFTSQPYRGLDWLLDLWGNIKREVPAASFDVFAPKAHQAAANAKKSALDGVTFRGSVPRSDLVRELATARVQLIPGHHAETYCLAAAEATAAGVPIVTLGLGALSERVRDGKTGFIASGKEEFAARTVTLLSDDALWRSMHEACLAEAALTTWDTRALEWEQLFGRLSG